MCFSEDKADELEIRGKFAAQQTSLSVTVCAPASETTVLIARLPAELLVSILSAGRALASSPDPCVAAQVVSGTRSTQVRSVIEIPPMHADDGPEQGALATFLDAVWFADITSSPHADVLDPSDLLSLVRSDTGFEAGDVLAANLAPLSLASLACCERRRTLASNLAALSPMDATLDITGALGVTSVLPISAGSVACKRRGTFDGSSVSTFTSNDAALKRRGTFDVRLMPSSVAMFFDEKALLLSLAAFS
mmetsp:Transcript_106340/g.266388  ORF Transcript_106340/g.266388 Transcript_106340/m.266388 type:complete len:250 (+) Transcript_106340:1129-1878(+)